MRYLPSERGWIKTKNRDYPRWEPEREGAFNSRRRLMASPGTAASQSDVIDFYNGDDVLDFVA
jgi:hypothetical protein